MNREPHHNAKWLGPSEAARFAGCDRSTLKKWAMAGQIRVRINPRRKGQNAWLYHIEDIKTNILGYNEN
jgi:predicted site-specific integrase-resolvase